MKLDKYKLIISGLVGITACSGLVITAVHADTPASSSSSANASITVANTINLTLTGGDLVIDNLTPGNASDSNIITATITSNSPYGYHLSATTGTSTGTTSLVNTANSNFSFTNLSTNKATLNDFSDNTWGYSYSTDNGTIWISGDYGSALSGYNGLTLDNDDSGATGTTLFNNDSYAGSTAVKFKIGAKSATTQAAGTYTGTVNFYAVTNPEPVIPTQSSCSDSPMISTVVSGITYMQDINSGNKSTVLSVLTQDATYQIKDNRDNETYCVGKLADGNLWLLDNLALDLTNSTVLSGMNESNTHASNTTLGYLKNGGGTTSDQYAITGVVNWTDSPTYASSNSYSDPLVNLTNKDTIPSDATSQAGQYKVGGYYNYCAASAGSYCYGNGTSGVTSSGDATEDICPKGWRLPTSNTTGEYQALYKNASYNTYVNYRSALRLPLSGRFNSGSASSRGSDGYFWSSTRRNNNIMYYLRLNTSGIYPADYSNRNLGFSVRCVLGS